MKNLTPQQKADLIEKAAEEFNKLSNARNSVDKALYSKKKEKVAN